MPRAFAAGDEELVEAERLIGAQMAGLDLDLLSMAAVSNIFRTATAVRKHMERAVLKSHSLSWSAFVILFVLRIWGKQESRVLAAEAGVSGGTLTGVLDTLERKGLASRHPVTSDRRRVEVVLTDAGTRVVNEVMPAINSVESRVTGGLDEDEKEMLARLLRKVLRSVEELDER
jgi:DNA-binding MarR family transcriptional regulator|tara:strand:+ start:124 stop:645 length:522 start_codon:yes stop_codon:yes gene_type:complete